MLRATVSCDVRRYSKLRFRQRIIIDLFTVHGLLLTTAYSGAGFFEATVAHIAEHAAACSGGKALMFRTFSACDIDETCRRVLTSHVGPGAPEHVHSDICSRWPITTQKKLERIRTKFSDDLHAYTDCGIKRKDAVTNFGTDMLDAMDAVLRSSEINTHGPCTKCGKDCQFVPGDCSWRHAHIAGATCVDYSAAGSRLRMVGPHSTAFACWGSERARRRELFVLLETRRSTHRPHCSAGTSPRAPT